MYDILVVDDEHPIRNLLQQILVRAGYRCRVAPDAAEARKLLATQPCNLLLSDIRMPGESGLDLIRHVRQSCPDTAVVVVSAIVEPDEARAVLELGVDGYIVKPFEVSQVMITVLNALKKWELEQKQKTYQAELEKTIRERTDKLEYLIGELKTAKEISDQAADHHRDQLYFMQTLIDAIPNPIFFRDTQHRYSGCNRSFESCFGVSRSRLIGKTVFDVFPDDQATAFHEIDSQLMRQPGHKTYEITVSRADKTPRDMMVCKATYFNTNGEVSGIVGVMMDITPRKEAETALAKAHQEMAALVAGISSILICLSDTRTVLRWNGTAEQVLGVPARAAVGQKMTTLPISWEKDVISDGLDRCQSRNQPVTLPDVRFTRTDGRQGFLGLKITLVCYGADKPGGFLILGADITERKILESQLTHAQKLESIGQLAAGIAHEINTPTQFVGDNIRFLGDAFADLHKLVIACDHLVIAAVPFPQLDPFVKDIESMRQKADLEYLTTEIPAAISQSLEGIRRITKIVRSMKEFSHPGVEEKTAVDLNQALESTITVARNEWKYVADLETDLCPNLPPVMCFPGEINQVFLNILINAAHAIEEILPQKQTTKGLIRVTTRCMDQQVQIRISDTGAGIPTAIRHRIFDPFFTTKEVGKGTGQGLAISHAVVVGKHGGQLHFETEAGEGTTFIIDLPIGEVPI